MIKDLDQKQCSGVLKNNYIGNLSYISSNRPYTIPITYFYNEKDNYMICYSGPGHKINAMRKKPEISLAVNTISSPREWKSVLVHGSYDEVDGGTAKLYLHEFSLGIKSIVLKKELKDLDYISEFSSKIYNQDIPIVFLISIEEMTGRMRS
ncbi:pyridoxamine 5'-phosphate oxidase family protein [Winogradskyella luteola]|uniref:Pyridoxamine 5'-phosphate oxidase family protein n=1 Tax=Winogradskyella luteola TaxID=2828330 RepID=A0A9X1JRB5_9FLAO|nr:pyridoxamine 5'-phosphate oxidase family protein [Winogradskyella luteola]MBV7268432.1 pyridoxamine 5'-phosphate oxidase family protein [Winogradskyella luteola]